MTAAPALEAVLADVVWCLGLGCLLGAGRDGVTLLLGKGPVRMFLADLAAFGAAAVLVCGFSAGVSASGVARWYMSGAVLLGALAWWKAVRPALHRLFEQLGRVFLWPFCVLARRVLHPMQVRLASACRHLQPRRRHKNPGEKAKNGKKQLQKPSKIVYN